MKHLKPCPHDEKITTIFVVMRVKRGTFLEKGGRHMLAKTVCTDQQYAVFKRKVDEAATKPVEFVENSVYVRDRDEILAAARKRVDDVLALQQRGLICTTGKFVPSVHYPPITQYPFHSQEEVMATYTMPEDGLLDIYVHIPFCAQHCSYCHYPGELGSCASLRKNQIKYLDHLEMEMDNYMKFLGVEKIKARSILFGGGTPTHMDPDLLERLMKFFTDRIDRTTVTQFNLDVDPMTLVGEDGLKRLEILARYGADRLTIGTQSLNKDILALMFRPPNLQMIEDSLVNCRAQDGVVDYMKINEMRDAGVEITQELLDQTTRKGFIINIEFIYGFMGQTLDNIADTIERACVLHERGLTDEIQTYRLKVDAYGDFQGIIGLLYDRDPAMFPDFEETMMQKAVTEEVLKRYGLKGNLRRVYTKDRRIYSHYAYNQCCAQYDQIGLGLTAFSSLRDRFFINTDSFDEYYEKTEAGLLGLNRGYVRDREQQVRWSIILPLKNTEVRKDRFRKINNMEIEDVFKKKWKKLMDAGLVVDKPVLGYPSYTLTELGKFVADECAEEFNACEFLPWAPDEYIHGDLFPYDDNTAEDALGLI